MNISVIDPISRAFRRAILITFRPFNIGKWFVLGFVAWLATLGDSWTNFNFNGSGSKTAPVPTSGPTSGPTKGTWSTTTWTSKPTMPEISEEVRGWITTHILVVVLIGLVLVVLGLAIGLLIAWITSRGKFMFLRGIATNTAEVVAPWKQLRELGNSLFGFNVVVWGVGLAVHLSIIGVAVLIAWDDIRSRTFGNQAVIALVFGIVLLLPAVIILGLVSWCTNSFVTVIMYATGKNAFAAWREFRADVVRGNVGTLILFLLMQIVLGVAVVTARFALGCLTCCIGFLPYVSTVAALPLIVFLRCYSIYFMQQFGPQYTIIIEAPPPAPPMGFPVIGMNYPPPQGPGSAQ